MVNLTKIVLSTLTAFHLSCSSYNLSKEEKWLIKQYPFFDKINNSSKIKIPVVDPKKFKNVELDIKTGDKNVVSMYAKFSYDVDENGEIDFYLLYLPLHRELNVSRIVDTMESPREVWYNPNENKWHIPYIWERDENGEYKRIK